MIKYRLDVWYKNSELCLANNIFYSDLNHLQIGETLNEYIIGPWQLSTVDEYPGYFADSLPNLEQILNNLNIKRKNKMNINTEKKLMDLEMQLKDIQNQINILKEEPNEQYNQGDFLLIKNELYIISMLNYDPVYCFNIIGIQPGSNRYFGYNFSKEQLNKENLIRNMRTKHPIKKITSKEAADIIKFGPVWSTK